MRDLVLAFINTLSLRNYIVSNNLPFDNNGVALYLSNPKSIYVDQAQVITEPFIKMMNKTIDKETVSLDVYLATDAKQLPTDYSNTVSSLKNAISLGDVGFISAASEVTTEFVEDLLVTKLELKFERIIN